VEGAQVQRAGRSGLEDNKSISMPFYLFNSLGCFTKNVNGTGAVCDHKTPKFFVSHWEQSMAEHMGIKGVY
jgi:hypothetical protein